jgi:hypothetical protein
VTTLWTSQRSSRTSRGWRGSHELTLPQCAGKVGHFGTSGPVFHGRAGTASSSRLLPNPTPCASLLSPHHGTIHH